MGGQLLRVWAGRRDGALKGASGVTVTQVTFFVTAAEVTSLLPPEVSVLAQSYFLGKSGVVPHWVFLYSLKVLFPVLFILLFSQHLGSEASGSASQAL